MTDNKDKNVIYTGTTVVGVRFKDGIILGSDRQATSGDGKRAGEVEKIFQIDNFTVIGVAGIYGFCQGRITLFKKALKDWEIELKPHKISVKGRTKILHHQLLSSPGKEAFLLGLGKYDGSDFSLVKYDGVGAYITTDFAAIGSGESDAGPILETYNKKNPIKELDFEKAKELILEALGSAVTRDTGTGPKFDLFILDKDGGRFDSGGEQ